MYKIFTVIFVLHFQSIISLAQIKCDCIKATTLRPLIAKQFNSGNLDSAEVLIKTLQLEKNAECDIAYYSGVAQIAMSKKQFEKARDFLNNQEKVVLNMKCNAAKILCYNNFGRLFSETNKPDSVVYYGSKVMELSLEEKNWNAYARASVNIGVVFAQQKQFLKSIEYSNKALEAAKKANDSVILGAVLYRLADGYLKQFEINKDSNFLNNVYKYSNECILVSTGRSSLMEYIGAHNSLSKYFLIKKDYKKVNDLSNKVVATCPSGVYDFFRFLAVAYQNKSDVLLAQSNFSNAKNMADSAFKYANLHNIQLTIEPLNNIYLAAKALNDNKTALAAFERKRFLEDSLFSIEKNEKINELEKKYNQTKNEKTIKELDQQKKLYALLGLAGLLILGLIAFYLRQQSLKLKQKILETEQRLNRARMNPHFFFNALASLQNFAMNDSDSITMAENLSKFSHIMRETLENTYREYVSIYQENDFLNEYLELQTIRFPNKFNYVMEVDDDLEIDDLMIPSMILQPFVENCIEHGFSGINYLGLLSIKFAKENNEVKVTINDNGKGLIYSVKSKAEHISRASQIIKDRIYLLNIKLKTKARFSIDNNEDSHGVNVTIHLPILYKEDIIENE
jgi:hypothetical protein